VFKRRKELSWGRWIIEAVYPRSGWKRVVSYIGHRLHRLPDTPHKIARGIAVGVFASFSPLFGFHIVIATLLALLIRGNIIAALLSTIFGNPITFPIIAAVALTLGNWLLGSPVDPSLHESVFLLFGQATADFWYNFQALFTSVDADWTALGQFSRRILVPYFVGGLGPGLISALVAYYMSLPVIVAYKNRRKGRLAQRLRARREKPADRADDDA